MKYTISWDMPYQGAGVSTCRAESYEKAAEAYEQLISVQCDPGCSRAKAMIKGREISTRQLRAWARK